MSEAGDGIRDSAFGIRPEGEGAAPKLISRRRLAEIHGVSVQAVDKWIQRGLPHTTAEPRMPNERPPLLFDEAASAAWLKSYRAMGRTGGRRPGAGRKVKSKPAGGAAPPLIVAAQQAQAEQAARAQHIASALLSDPRKLAAALAAPEDGGMAREDAVRQREIIAAASAQMSLDVERGMLVDADECAAAWGSLLNRLRIAIEHLADLLEPDLYSLLGASTEQRARSRELIDTHARRLLATLSDDPMGKQKKEVA